MGTHDIEINRDTDNDVLYVFDKRYDRLKTRNRQIGPNIFGRFETEGHQCVGLTIESFSVSMPHFKNYSDYVLGEKFDPILEWINATLAGQQLA